MPRFVILRHDPAPVSDRTLHWDLMLESGIGLLTWALEREPIYGTSLVAEQLTDHRHDYLDYEGPVAGGRGTVTRWDSGEFEWRQRSDGELVIKIRGAVVQGQVRFVRSATQPQRWAVSFFPESSENGR